MNYSRLTGGLFGEALGSQRYFVHLELSDLPIVSFAYFEIGHWEVELLGNGGGMLELLATEYHGKGLGIVSINAESNLVPVQFYC